jgi:hypothetical protein
MNPYSRTLPRSVGAIVHPVFNYEGADLAKARQSEVDKDRAVRKWKDEEMKRCKARKPAPARVLQRT